MIYIAPFECMDEAQQLLAEVYGVAKKLFFN